MSGMRTSNGIWNNKIRREGRRSFIKAMAAAALSLAFPTLAGAFFATGFPVRTVEDDEFAFDIRTGRLKWRDGKVEEPYSLTVDGLVKNPLKLSYGELAALSPVEQTTDFHCVEGWSVKDVRWGGFRLAPLIKKAEPLSGAGYAVFHSLGRTRGRPGGLDHYVESCPLSYLLDRDQKCLMALHMNGKPLSFDHGAPLRLVAPYLLGYKNIKFVTRVEIAKVPRPGWWTEANPIYPIDAPVPKDRLRDAR